ncbi:hypothetical protein BYT27DRAFT_6965415 [Phlegmacium glaucopus]|nr:hypothetical protein BYT27DRAFT_6965415 [Phlegmacium glaucopus]
MIYRMIPPEPFISLQCMRIAHILSPGVWHRRRPRPFYFSVRSGCNVECSVGGLLYLSQHQYFRISFWSFSSLYQCACNGIGKFEFLGMCESAKLLLTLGETLFWCRSEVVFKCIVMIMVKPMRVRSKVRSVTMNLEAHLGKKFISICWSMTDCKQVPSTYATALIMFRSSRIPSLDKGTSAWKS